MLDHPYGLSHEKMPYTIELFGEHIILCLCDKWRHRRGPHDRFIVEEKS